MAFSGLPVRRSANSAIKTGISVILLTVLGVCGVKAQLTVHFEDQAKEVSKQYLMHWDGFETRWHGKALTLAKEGDMGDVPASEETFSAASISDTFGFEVTAVSDWDMAAANAQIASDTLPAYLASLTPSFVNIHGGVPMGLGVDNDNNSVDGNRRDKIDDPGEALIITFDLSGQLTPTENTGTYGPESNSTFTNGGMGELSKLMLDAVWMKKYDTASLRQNGRVDFIFYDASENQVVQQSIYSDVDDNSAGTNIIQPQEVGDGDILILAHPTLSTDSGGSPVDLTYIVSELWGLTFDIEFTPPPADPIVIPPVVNQHPFNVQSTGLPGFANIPREDGELVALFRTDGDLVNFDALRTVVMDFHRGYLITQTRGTTNGNAWGVFDISNITSGDAGLPDPTERTPTQVGPWHKTSSSTPMHTAFGYETELRVNNPGSDYYDLSGLPNLTTTFPSGYQQAGTGGARSAFHLPYNYQSSGNGPVAIWDARTGQELSNMTEHGFGAIAVPMGNVLILAKIRAGERAIATYDISDPSRPALLDVMRGTDHRWRTPGANGAYEPAIFENYLILSNSLRGGYTVFIDFSDPSNLRVHHKTKPIPGSERYIQFQDNRMFAGTEVIDLSHIDYGISTVEHNFGDYIDDEGTNFGTHKGEYMLPLGNLVVCAENSEQGLENLAAIYAFQAEPDVKGPEVGYHLPVAGATDQAVTARIGLMIHETLDSTTLTDQTLKVFKVGDPEVSIPGTRTFSDKDVVTFTPDQPLDYSTTYRVVAEGITDISGNPMERYEFDFTTQASGALWYPEINSVGISYVPSIVVGQPITFFTDATPDGGEDPSTLEYRWDFGDGTATEWSSHFEATHTYNQPGAFDVKAQVRSVNAPHLVTMRQLQPTALFKSAGEDAFEPRIEAENGVQTGPNGSIVNSPESSGGKYALYEVNSGGYWDFDSVGGHFDFQFLVAMPEGVEIPGNQSFSWRMRVYLSEIVGGVATNEVYLGEFSTRSQEYEYKGFTGYLPREGRYRIELRDGSGVREPRVDYVDIKVSSEPVHLEADLLESGSITNGFIMEAQAGSAWEDATGGFYVEGSEGFEIQWGFNAFQAGTYNLALRASSLGTGPSQMGLYVNGERIQPITLSAGNFEDVFLSVELLEGANTIELRDSEGGAEFNVDFLDVTVPAWVAPIPPQKSSQITLDETNRRIYTVNPDNDTITAIDADASPPVKLWERVVSKNPRNIGVDALGRIWVTCFGGDSIDVIDPNDSNNDFVYDLPHGAAPHDIVFNHAGTRAFVSLYGYNTVLQFDAETSTADLISQATTGPRPTALALNSDESKLLVSRFVSGTNSGEVYEVSIDPISGFMELSSTVQLAPDTTSEDGPNSGRGVPNYLSSIAIHPETGDAYVASQKANTLGGNFLDSTTLNHDSTVRSIVSVVDTETQSERLDERVDIDDSSQPSALWFAPGGNYLFVALQGNNIVEILGSGVGVGTLDVGLAPQGMAFDPATNRLYVKNFMDRSVTVHDLSNSLLLGNFSNTFETSISTVANETLTGSVLQGKQVFYNAADVRMSQDGYLSCASCHQDGGHDGAIWDFTQRGEGLRNTTDLRGRAGMAHGRVHWSGNFDEIQDFELDIVNDFGGDGFIAGGEANDSLGASNANRSVELDALADYISSLDGDSLPNSPFKDPVGVLTADGLAGRVVFGALACATCHDPLTDYTDSATGVLHDVGTLKAGSGQRLGGTLSGIDTPTLLGLHDTAPYFHDGSAATLEAVFDPSGDPERAGEIGKEHDLSSLDPNQLTQLIAYLNELDALDRSVPPTFTANPFYGVDATEGVPYAGSISDSAIDANGDSLTYSIESGPSWLSVAPDGTLSGTPTSGDLGENTFHVQVTAVDGIDVANLVIHVDAGTNIPYVDSADRLAHVTFDSDPQDSDGNLSLSLSGGATVQPGFGQFLGVVRLNGGSDAVAIANHSDFDSYTAPITQRTISLWFAVDSVSGRQMIFESGGTTAGFNIYLDEGTLYAGAWDTILDAGDVAPWPGTWRSVGGIEADRWYHVALVLDASANPTTPTAEQFFAYLDGVEFDVGNSVGMQLGGHADGSAIGGVASNSKYHDGGNDPANIAGEVDDFAVWNRALSASEIERLVGPPVNIVIDMVNTSGTAEPTKAWIFSGLNSLTPSATKADVSTYGSIGIIGDSDTFTVTASALDDWSTAAATAATGDFQSYLGSLEATNSSGIDGLAGGNMGVGDTWMNGTNEALVFTVDKSGLPESAELYLREMSFTNYTAPDWADFIIFRPGTNEVIETQWNANYNGPDKVTGNWLLEDGDKIILATGSNNTNAFRFKGMTLAVAAPIGLTATIENANGTTEASKIWTITDLDRPSLSVTNGTATTSGSPGTLDGNDSFTVTTTAVDNWGTLEATSAAAGDFQTYLAGLNAAQIGVRSGIKLGVTNNWIGGTNEALVFTIDRSSLPSSVTLTLKEFKFDNYGSGERTDFVIFRPGIGVIETQWNVNYNGSDTISGSWVLQDGDQIIIGTGSNNTNSFRYRSMTLQLEDAQ